MMSIHSFFKLLCTEGGAVWLEKGSIRLSTPGNLRNKEIAKFILKNKDRIISILRENRIHSKLRFFDVPVLYDQRRPLQPAFETVKPYQPKRNGRLPYMIFIHPSQLDWEVYRPLADMLAGEFNCIGIDNYNLHHTEKILSLSELATYYLSTLLEKKWLKVPVNLLGWSLGGHIALEMAAILEKTGFRHINIFLLDTFLPGPPAKNKKNMEQEQEMHEIMEMAAAASTGEEKIAATLHSEYLLASIPVSRYLKYSSLFEFRALRQLESLRYENAGAQHRKKLSENHVKKAAASVLTIKLDCNHYDMLDTNSESIAAYILSLE